MPVYGVSGSRPTRVSRTPGSGRIAKRRSTSTCAWPAPSSRMSVSIGTRDCMAQRTPGSHGTVSRAWDQAGLPRPCCRDRLRRSAGGMTMRAMTWSILARDPVTGTLGAAVATRFFAVGALAIHVEGGVAALATQALINPMFAVLGMPRLRAGEEPAQVADSLLAADAGQPARQLHILDAAGRIAAFTGADCIGWCGSVRGTDVSVAGNMLAG